MFTRIEPPPTHFAEHPNVLALVGVVTIPRGMPVLLLLVYCESGALDSYLRDAIEQGNITPAVLRLSWIADIADGLRYLASVRIVHRDVAARNILLDVSLTCKVRQPDAILACSARSASQTPLPSPPVFFVFNVFSHGRILRTAGGRLWDVGAAPAGGHED